MEDLQLLQTAASLLKQTAVEEGSSGWVAENANEGSDHFPMWMVTNDAFHNPPDDDDTPWLAVEVHTGTQATANYIALTQPTFGAAVATWLTTAAADLWAHGPLCCPDGCLDCDDIAWAPHVRQALAVARTLVPQP